MTEPAPSTKMKKILPKLRAFFDWFDPRNFMDVYQEWHAFVEGFAEGFCIFKDAYYSPSDECLKDLKSEHHYYVAGRALGFAALLVMLTAVSVWIIGAIRG